MTQLDAVKDALPEAAKDLKLNLGNVLGAETLSVAQRWGTAIAAALAARNERVRDALLDAARTAGASDETIDDARAAAALMAMNNVYYRSRHMLGGTYAQRPARLRMQRIGSPRGPKLDFELFCAAVSFVNGCETCVRAHEKTVRDAGLSEDAVLDALRIAAVVHGTACALEMG